MLAFMSTFLYKSIWRIQNDFPVKDTNYYIIAAAQSQLRKYCIPSDEGLTLQNLYTILMLYMIFLLIFNIIGFSVQIQLLKHCANLNNC